MAVGLPEMRKQWTLNIVVATENAKFIFGAKWAGRERGQSRKELLQPLACAVDELGRTLEVPRLALRPGVSRLVREPLELVLFLVRHGLCVIRDQARQRPSHSHHFAADISHLQRE